MKTEKVQLSPRGTTAVAAGVLALAALWAYRGSFSAPFFFDDQPAIAENETIRHLGAIGQVLWPPSLGISSVAGRPLVNLSLAVNYAWGGLDVRGYHAVNLAIHILAGLTLFGIVRRTLETTAPTLLAFAIALLWTLHPLQTESVTFVVQRTELLMGLFYLLTLYCFIRGVAAGGGEPGFARCARAEPVLRRSLRASEGGTGEKTARITSLGWFVLSCLGCLFGMAAKEAMVSAPLLVFLYDRTFISGSFREAWRRRRLYYAGLGATWLPLGFLMIYGGGSSGRAREVGFGFTEWTYALTQCRAIMMYLKLAIWPHPLVVDYGTEVVAHLGEVALQATGVVVLVVGTGWSLCCRPAELGPVRLRRAFGGQALGFAGAWFFLILAPSSSVVPLLTQTMAEHRMYLPLAAVIALLVYSGYALLAGAVRGQREVSTGVVCCYLGVLFALSVGLGTLTARRNEDYRSALAIWSDTAAKRPGNVRAQNNLGVALNTQGRTPEAIAACRRALQLKPDYPEAHLNLGKALQAAGRAEEAIAQFEETLRLQPDNPAAQSYLGEALAAGGQLAEAMAHYEQVFRLEPNFPQAHYNLGNALAIAGRLPEAIAHYQEALRLKPEYAEAHCNLGDALMGEGRTPEAIAQFEEAVRLKPEYAEAHSNLGNALAVAGRLPEAIVHCREALQLNPGYPEAHNNLGYALAAAGRSAEAIAQYEQALKLRPDFSEAEDDLGAVLAQTGRLAEAIPHIERAARLNPGNAKMQHDLGVVLRGAGRTAEAAAHFDEARRLEAGSRAIRN